MVLADPEQLGAHPCAFCALHQVPTWPVSCFTSRLRELIPESCWSVLDTATLLDAAANPTSREGLRLPPYIMSRCPTGGAQGV